MADVRVMKSRLADQPDRFGHDTIPFAGGGHFACEEMSEMLTALSAYQLCSFPSIGAEKNLLYLLALSHPETGKATSGIEGFVVVEQFISASGTHMHCHSLSDCFLPRNEFH